MTRINPKQTALFMPPNLRRFKKDLFERVGYNIGRIVPYDYQLLDELPDDIIPIVGCSIPLEPFYKKWKAQGRTFIYWDRGYFRRVNATWLPLGYGSGYYRWHVNRFQMNEVLDVPRDRWLELNLNAQIRKWQRGGRKIVIADTLPDYWLMRGLPPDWSQQMANELKKKTDRPIVIREKHSTIPLYEELVNAHCLVAHGSIAAVESVIFGCPVFVDAESAAAPMGRVGFDDIENPVFPDRMQWLYSLAYSQYSEKELVDGTLWKFLR